MLEIHADDELDCKRGAPPQMRLGLSAGRPARRRYRRCCDGRCREWSSPAPRHISPDTGAEINFDAVLIARGAGAGAALRFGTLPYNIGPACFQDGLGTFRQCAHGFAPPAGGE